MTRADADRVESCRSREADPRRKKAHWKIALPQSLDSWAIRTRLVYGHRSAEINDRFELLQGHLCTAPAFADGFVRIAARLLSRVFVGEPIPGFANHVAGTRAHSRASRT